LANYDYRSPTTVGCKREVSSRGGWNSSLQGMDLTADAAEERMIAQGQD
jgi:hypothetical protein